MAGIPSTGIPSPRSVTLNNVSKVYPGGCQAVRELCLEVASGELLVIVGPSGCGKSTTLRMIAGLESPTSGEIRLGDQLANRLRPRPRDRDVAMVFQSDALYPHMTVRQNMAFALKRRRTPPAKINASLQETAKMLSIESLLQRRPSELSGGEQQRVALGRAMVRRPSLFLLDEPLSNLDPQLRAQLREEIALLHQRLGTTMLYVTHDQTEAMTLGHRLALMDQGVLQQLGKPLEVYRRPANRFVATFIGSPAMNLLAGEVTDDRFRSTNHAAECRVPGAPPGAAVLGVRPEEIVVAPPGELPFALAKRTRIEPLGHESIVHLEVAGQPFRARASTQAAGDWPAEANIALRRTASHHATVHPSAAVHLFTNDAEGRAIWHAG